MPTGAHSMERPGLGPPDLCQLVRTSSAAAHPAKARLQSSLAAPNEDPAHCTSLCATDHRARTTTSSDCCCGRRRTQRRTSPTWSRWQRRRRACRRPRRRRQRQRARRRGWRRSRPSRPSGPSPRSGRLCAWNAFTQADVCIDFRIPGGTVAFTTRDGMRYTLARQRPHHWAGVLTCTVASMLRWCSADVSENEWQQLAVSCGLRALVPATDSQPGLR